VNRINGIKEMVQYRINGKSLSTLSKEGFKTAVQLIILKGAVIYGAVLPETAELANLLNDEFALMLKRFGYMNLTQEEVVYAFRMNACAHFISPLTMNQWDNIPFTGSFFNIAFSGAVLKTYKNFRNAFDSYVIENEASVIQSAQ
jgi:hypothetical protein